jgi:hypothetical protein
MRLYHGSNTADLRLRTKLLSCRATKYKVVMIAAGGAGPNFWYLHESYHSIWDMTDVRKQRHLVSLTRNKDEKLYCNATMRAA